MKIVKVRTVPVWCARRRPYGQVTRTALGPAAISDYTIVFIDTDAGITGIGEACSVFKRRGALLRADVDVLAAAVIGEDPFAIAHLVGKMDQTLDGVEEAKAGIEMALWDIKGKALDTPVYNLLGGKVRERIPLSYSIPFGTPEQMAAFAAEKAEAGHRTIKVKVGSEDGARDIAAVKAIREAIGPNLRLRVDGNMGWPTAKHAIRMIRAMEPWNLELVEQPLPAHDLDGMAEVRRNIGVPLMADESVRDPRSAMEVIKRGAADIANVYVTEAGGLLKATRIFAMCEAAGMPCMIGSMPEFGIGTAAQIHLGVAMTNLGPDSDACGVLYHEEDLLKPALKIENGFSYPPEGPGLGVTIDQAVFERWQRGMPAAAND
jgi:muconate cycloisomerase